MSQNISNFPMCFNKVVVIGDTGVGKSSLINHLIGEEVAAVNAVASCTEMSNVYKLGDNIEIVDTRGTDEIYNDNQTWEEVELTLLTYKPKLVIWCLDGSKRDGLDIQFEKLENILNIVFEKIKLDPDLAIIINKVDILEPQGIESLPEHWLNLRSEKGRNINERSKQVNNLHAKFVNTKLTLLEPTCLEWYKSATPWNLGTIRTLIIDQYVSNDRNVIAKVSTHTDLFQDILGIQTQAIFNDSRNDNNDLMKQKNDWATEYLMKLKSFKPTNYSQVKDIPLDPMDRLSYFQSVLTFKPYIRFTEEVPEIKYDAEKFYRILIDLLVGKGATKEECNAFMSDFAAIGKTLNVSGWCWLGKLFFFVVFGGILAWWLAPVIGAWIGGTLFGLSGAAATSAGLAWLGLGALAAGGFGMFGGTIVIIGAGAVLAAGTGAVAMKALSDTLCPEIALMDCSKTIQSFNEILKQAQEDKGKEPLVLQYTHLFASTIYELKQEENRIEDKRKKVYIKGLAIYKKAFEIINNKRLNANILFNREKEIKTKSKS